MKVEKPAEGILKTHNWGDSKVYKIVCECGDPDHEHNVWIEADDSGVAVNTYVTVRTNFWSKTRWHHIWQLLTKGYIDLETSITMSQQQSVNYAHAMLNAIEDVIEFRKKK
jgi:hypothetical protein